MVSIDTAKQYESLSMQWGERAKKVAIATLAVEIFLIASAVRSYHLRQPIPSWPWKAALLTGGLGMVAGSYGLYKRGYYENKKLRSQPVPPSLPPRPFRTFSVSQGPLPTFDGLEESPYGPKALTKFLEGLKEDGRNLHIDLRDFGSLVTDDVLEKIPEETCYDLLLRNAKISPEKFFAFIDRQFLAKLTLEDCDWVNDTFASGLASRFSVRFRASARIEETKFELGWLSLIDCSHLTGKGLSVLIEALAPYLTYLDISGCHKISGEHLTSLSRLEKIDSITAMGCPQILEGSVVQDIYQTPGVLYVDRGTVSKKSPREPLQQALQKSLNRAVGESLQKSYERVQVMDQEPRQLAPQEKIRRLFQEKWPKAIQKAIKKTINQELSQLPSDVPVDLLQGALQESVQQRPRQDFHFPEPIANRVEALVEVLSAPFLTALSLPEGIVQWQCPPEQLPPIGLGSDKEKIPLQRLRGPLGQHSVIWFEQILRVTDNLRELSLDIMDESLWGDTGHHYPSSTEGFIALLELLKGHRLLVLTLKGPLSKKALQEIPVRCPNLTRLKLHSSTLYEGLMEKDFLALPKKLSRLHDLDFCVRKGSSGEQRPVNNKVPQLISRVNKKFKNDYPHVRLKFSVDEPFIEEARTNKVTSTLKGVEGTVIKLRNSVFRPFSKQLEVRSSAAPPPAPTDPGGSEGASSASNPDVEPSASIHPEPTKGQSTDQPPLPPRQRVQEELAEQALRKLTSLKERRETPQGEKGQNPQDPPPFPQT